MYGTHSDKLVKQARLNEVLGYLLKVAESLPGFPDPGQGMVQATQGSGIGEFAGNVGSTTLKGLDYLNTAKDTAQGVWGASGAVRAGQGVRAAGSAFARPFMPTAAPLAADAGMLAKGLSVGGKVLAPLGVAASAYSTYNNAQDMYSKYKNQGGTRYLTSRDGILDTINAVGDAAPLVGAGVGAGIGAAGGGIGAAPGMVAGTMIGGAVQLGAHGITGAYKGVTGYDTEKNNNARALVTGEGFGSANDQFMEGLQRSGQADGSDFKGKSWFGNETGDYRREQTKNYMDTEREARVKARSSTPSSTSKSQVA